MALAEQLEQMGKQLAERETTHAAKLAQIHQRAVELHERVRVGLEGFHRGSREAGAPHLAVELSAPRIDDKHLHSVQFDLARGRHRVIVTLKSKGEVTLVGPFKAGKQEGPCNSIALDDDPAIDAGLAEVLAEFLEVAFAP
ncbi:MAG: hypothetical protein JRG89_10620 [Deltaproteobacteria bacterium]|nr:hypothetical protein [Deltaproteobacteria bacterium]MBW2388878.1 hypothetical protein [Deltaproteobacteria bacterium]MBW2726108.1 hypothetical protein [Deltaproteobacteria bacterium]